MSFTPTQLDSRRSSGDDGALDWSRGSSLRSGGAFSGQGNGVVRFILDRSSSLDQSSSKANNANPRMRSHIRRMASLVVDPIELDLDQSRLQNAVREAGEYSFGVDAIAVWVLDEENGKLVHPEGGWWCSHKMEDVGNGSGSTRDIALARLEDRTRDDYVPPKPVSPGTDIAGILWAESRGGRLRRRGSMRSMFDSGVSLKSLEHQQLETSNVLTLNYQPIRWRDIKSISQDPDSAKGPRLKLMEEAGFTMAAGITFQYMHHQGMVIFLTTVEDQNDDRLNSVTNGAYLYQAAQFIGAQLSLAELRRAALADRYKLKDKCYCMRDWNALTTQPLLESAEEGMDGNGRADNDSCQAHVNNKDTNHHASSCCHIPPQVIVWSNKLKGGSMQIPPVLSWTQTSWTIFGSFVGLLILSGLNEYYKILSDYEYQLLIGPFGAMCTLMYGLSSAPASQPRNAVMGQVIAGAISLGFTYIPESVLPVWLRTAVGPAFAIGAMVKLGVVHPPAGAHSVLYASGKHNFGFYGLVVLSTAISVIPATVVNNMSSKRQYPTYWGLNPVNEAFSWFCQCLGSRDDEKQKINFESKSIKNNLESAKALNLAESGGPAGSSKTSNTKVQPNRLMIHEEYDENSSHENTPDMLDIQKVLSVESDKDFTENK